MKTFGPRRAAVLVWCALLVVPLAFLAVIVATATPGSPELANPFFWVAVGASIIDVALSRLVPPRLRGAAKGPLGVAFTRLLVALALCEAAALFPLVAYLVTGDVRLIGIFAVDLFALVLLYPTEAQLERLAPRDPPGPALAGRMER